LELAGNLAVVANYPRGFKVATRKATGNAALEVAHPDFSKLTTSAKPRVIVVLNLPTLIAIAQMSRLPL
jgi:hypothetical protein